MRRLQWMDAYVSGDSEIDRQHREIVDHVNAVFAVVERGMPRDAVIEALDVLREVLESHWRDEERLFEHRESPFAEEQRLAHRAMRHEIVWIRSRMGESDDGAVAKGGRALRVWTETRFVQHVAEDIRALGPRVGGNERG